MTCKQLGGSCDTAFTADTLDEIIQQGTDHVLEMASQDEEHGKAKQMMDEAQKNPQVAQEWYKGVAEVFASQPTL